MYLLLLENYFKLGGGRFEYFRNIYTFSEIEHIYQYLDHELFKHLKDQDSDDFWDDSICEIMNENCGFFIYEFSTNGENKPIFESIDKTWSEFYKFCFSKDERISTFNQFIKK
jgi:hypothetical protein